MTTALSKLETLKPNLNWARLSSLNLNDRQRQAITFARLEGRITNASYQKLVGGSRRTALRELDALVQFGILDPKGKGRGAHYVIAKTKRAINAPNAPNMPNRKRATKGTKGT